MANEHKHLQFEQEANQVLSLLVDYLKNLHQLEIVPDLQPGQLAKQFAPEPKEDGVSIDCILTEVRKKIIPGLTHWQHPNFFSYYPAASSIPAILSEWITATFGAVGLQWSASPIATELECVVMDWIAKLLQLPANSPFYHTSKQGGGIIQNTAGDAIAVITTAARIDKHLDIAQKDSKKTPDIESLFYQDSSKLVAYMSDQTHFSGIKAARVAGIRVHKIQSVMLANGNLGINRQAVEEAIAVDVKNGLTPCYVQLNYGSTNTCGFDDLASFVGFAKEHKVWLHVDAAYAGSSLILPEFADKAEQIAKIATSFNFNGSKWFLCGFDSAFLYVRDRKKLLQVYTASDNFMAEVADDDIYNPEFRDWSIPLGRRFRSLRIWMVLEYFGAAGLRKYQQDTIQQANWLREQITKSQHYILPVNTTLGLVCLQLKENRHRTPELIRHLTTNPEAPCLIYPSLLAGEPMVRVALGGANTDITNVRALWLRFESFFASKFQ